MIIDNLEDALNKVLGNHLRHHRHKHITDEVKKLTLKFDITKDFSTDANGNADFEVYSNPMGRVLRIGRVVLWGAGLYTPAKPYLDSTGNTMWYGLFVGPNAIGVPKDYFPYIPATTTPMIPNVAEYSGLNALQFDHQEKIHFYMQGGPASKSLAIEVIGFAEPIASDFEL